ncbi:WD repeat-containing protein 34 [Polyrhizophydium stewartii]|uniref:WD repeat-containing protein 34 n=1 Tax=Polyrhizophydium stewartii TaxID=2732419 RepID=A0ABR4MWZ7_9FUNG
MDDAPRAAAAAVAVAPAPRAAAARADAACMTLPLRVAAAACADAVAPFNQTQTDPPPLPPNARERHAAAAAAAAEATAPALAAFLARIEPDVSALLLRNVRSTAFHGFAVAWDDDIDATSCPFVLRHAHRASDTGCTDLAWSKSGASIAAAYGRIDHASWCTHKGMVCAWNISARDLNPDAATFAAETSVSPPTIHYPSVVCALLLTARLAQSCLMAIAFHPEIPSMLAGGTFNGEVVVWRTADTQDPLVASSTPSELAHQEPVSKLVWIPADDRPSKFNVRLPCLQRADQSLLSQLLTLSQLLSISNDGKLLVWDLENKLVQPKLFSQILLRHIPKQLRAAATLPKTDAVVGATCVSVSRYNQQEYIVGTEAGHILKYSLSALTSVSAKTRDAPPTKPSHPVLLGFTPHVGPVQTVAFSPFHRNLFLSCGSDGLLRLFNQLQTKPLLTWEPSAHALCTADWSPFRPTVFACTTIQGSALIYDLSVSRGAPVVVLKVADSQGLCATVGLFNPKHPELFATGDATGRIKVWRLSTRLSVGADSNLDASILDKLGSGMSA